MKIKKSNPEWILSQLEHECTADGKKNMIIDMYRETDMQCIRLALNKLHIETQDQIYDEDNETFNSFKIKIEDVKYDCPKLYENGNIWI